MKAAASINSNFTGQNRSRVLKVFFPITFYGFDALDKIEISDGNPNVKYSGKMKDE